MYALHCILYAHTTGHVEGHFRFQAHEQQHQTAACTRCVSCQRAQAQSQHRLHGHHNTVWTVLAAILRGGAQTSVTGRQLKQDETLVLVAFRNTLMYKIANSLDLFRFQIFFLREWEIEEELEILPQVRQ